MLLFRTTIVCVVAAMVQTQTPPPPAPDANALAISWRFSLAAGDNASPVPWLVPGKTRIFVADPLTNMTAHDSTDGHAVWSSTEPAAAPPVLAGDNVVVPAQSMLFVLAQDTGQVRWSVKLESAPRRAFADGDRIGVVFDGGIQVWDSAGSAVWRAELAGLSLTPVVSSASLFIVGTDEPALVAFDAVAGAQRWKVTLKAKPRSLVAAAERVYFGADDGAQYSYGTVGTPKREWRQQRVRAIGQPIVDSKSVYFALLDNALYAFVAKGGTERWNEVLESRPLTGPLQLADSLAVALVNGRVVELAPTTGKFIHPGPPASGPPLRLLTASAAPDGSGVYTITIAKDQSRVLAVWKRPMAGKASH